MIPRSSSWVFWLIAVDGALSQPSRSWSPAATITPPPTITPRPLLDDFRIGAIVPTESGQIGVNPPPSIGVDSLYLTEVNEGGKKSTKWIGVDPWFSGTATVTGGNKPEPTAVRVGVSVSKNAGGELEVTMSEALRAKMDEILNKIPPCADANDEACDDKRLEQFAGEAAKDDTLWQQMQLMASQLETTEGVGGNPAAGTALVETVNGIVDAAARTGIQGAAAAVKEKPLVQAALMAIVSIAFQSYGILEPGAAPGPSSKVPHKVPFKRPPPRKKPGTGGGNQNPPADQTGRETGTDSIVTLRRTSDKKWWEEIIETLGNGKKQTRTGSTGTVTETSATTTTTSSGCPEITKLPCDRGNCKGSRESQSKCTEEWKDCKCMLPRPMYRHPSKFKKQWRAVMKILAEPPKPPPATGASCNTPAWFDSATWPHVRDDFCKQFKDQANPGAITVTVRRILSEEQKRKWLVSQRYTFTFQHPGKQSCTAPFDCMKEMKAFESSACQPDSVKRAQFATTKTSCGELSYYLDLGDRPECLGVEGGIDKGKGFGFTRDDGIWLIKQACNKWDTTRHSDEFSKAHPNFAGNIAEHEQVVTNGIYRDWSENHEIWMRVIAAYDRGQCSTDEDNSKWREKTKDFCLEHFPKVVDMCPPYEQTPGRPFVKYPGSFYTSCFVFSITVEGYQRLPDYAMRLQVGNGTSNITAPIETATGFETRTVKARATVRLGLSD